MLLNQGNHFIMFYIYIYIYIYIYVYIYIYTHLKTAIRNRQLKVRSI